MNGNYNMRGATNDFISPRNSRMLRVVYIVLVNGVCGCSFSRLLVV